MVIISDCSGFTYNTTANVVSAPVLSIQAFTAAYPSTAIFLAGQVVKDLGRSINVFDPANSNNLYQIYRQVMLFSGPDNGQYEGVTKQIAYICTWSADGVSQADVARTG